MFNWSHLAASASSVLALALAIAPAAHAAMPTMVIPQAISAASFKSSLPCLQPDANSAGPALGGLSRTQAKSAAILGGKISKLELMRLNQSVQATAQAAIAAPSSSELASPQPQGLGATCLVGGEMQVGTLFARPEAIGATVGPNDFLASKRLRISRTTFDPEWSRVQRQGLGRSMVTRSVGISDRGGTEATLAKINVWANRRVRFVEDRDLYGRSDYWASAASTLKRGAGDCEDIAIVKMQMLAALGVSRSDMYLTVARDLARNADHAMLVVKLGDRFWMLDNATDKLLDGSQSHDYRPIMSFSSAGKWLHGYAPS